MAQLLAFIILSAGLAFLSRRCLFQPRVHGFYRFFAFEAILALILVNAELWLRQPFSALQIVSWLLLFSSVFMAIHGFRMLRRIGRPDGRVENTTLLVKQGAYKYIRHPLYGSLLLLAWGAFFKNPSIIGIILVLLASSFLVATARVEEKENINKFGEKYIAYMKTTRMFIPCLF